MCARPTFVGFLHYFSVELHFLHTIPITPTREFPQDGTPQERWLLITRQEIQQCAQNTGSTRRRRRWRTPRLSPLLQSRLLGLRTLRPKTLLGEETHEARTYAGTTRRTETFGSHHQSECETDHLARRSRIDGTIWSCGRGVLVGEGLRSAVAEDRREMREVVAVFGGCQ
jgi:hypothetical protein